MSAVLLSAILFGLVHPGSKWIMGHGIGLLPFCLLYVGIRLFVQVPFILRNGNWKIKSRAELLILASLGIVGGLLQLSEFYGISKGVPVSIVTFLVYTHPVWTILFARVINKEQITAASIGKLASALAGIALISGVALSGGYDLKNLLAPLFAAIMIALWVTLSNRARKAGSTSLAISFYYDFFCLISLVLVTGIAAPQAHGEAIRFLMNPRNALMIGFYSIGIGLIPNYLFYSGSRTVSAVTAGFVLLLEPVISSSLAHTVWGDACGKWFILGAALILATNAPLDAVLSRLQFVSSRLVKKGAALLALLILCLIPNQGYGSEPLAQVHFVEIVPESLDAYTVSGEMKQMNLAIDLAEKQYAALNPSCPAKAARIIRNGSESELFTEIHSLAQEKTQQIVVGLSRTDFARIAAKAAQGSKLIAISSGASATSLKQINPRFVSIVSPWSTQWELVKSRMEKDGCRKENTVTIFDPKSFLSSLYRDAFDSSGMGTALETSQIRPKDFVDQLKGKKCAFLAFNFSSAQDYIETLMTTGWTGSLFGVGDWNFYSNELKKTLSDGAKNHFITYVPTGWTATETKEARKFSRAVLRRLREEASPVGAYTYDSVLLALDSACHGTDLLRFDAARVGRLPLLRKYQGIASSGNYLSQDYLLVFGSEARNVR